jgi:hypothetical protein
MKKKDLMLFIEKVEVKAVKSVEEKYRKLIEDEKLKVLENNGYTKRINVIQKKVNDLFTEAQTLMLDVNEDVSVRYEGYYNIAQTLSSYTGKTTIFESIKKCGKYDGGSVELIKDELYREVQLVKENYKKVKVVANSYLNAAKIAEYLKGLGFDLTSLEKQESTALVCEIDKSKLFVCGENK